ncbi:MULTISPECIES: hypothetical protein [Xanthomonas]|uniref:hypothetical protein n=1 Tax=Xanthomonas TaxID=338 RepID=UPI001290879B|nr:MULTISPECIES: hypothetical protein [Xanthomonas]
MKVDVRFYSIDACGYYPVRGKKRFGSLQKILAELESWVATKDLVNTKLPYKDGSLPAYLADVSQRSGIYIVVLWIEVPSTSDGGVSSIQARAKVGSAATFSNSIQPGTIPGYPCYFAFMPRHNMAMSLRLDSSEMGLPSLKGYIESFLATRSSAVRVSARDSAKVVGYTDDQGVEHDDLEARFRLSLIRHGEQSEFIKQNAHLVRKIVRVRTLESTRPRDRVFWQGLLRELWGDQAPETEMRTRIKYEMGVSSLDPVKIGNLVDENADLVVSQKNDFGFVFEGDASSIHWLSNSIAKLDFEIRIENEVGMVPATQLLSRVVDRKNQLIDASGAGDDSD